MRDERALQEMIAHACLDKDAEALFSSDFSAYLEQHNISASDREAMLEHPQRLSIYRHLVRNNMRGVTERLLMRTRARMNERAPGQFEKDFDSFLEARAPQTHHLRDVPMEFFRWIYPTWKARLDFSRYWLDLAQYELAFFEVSSLPHVEEHSDLSDLSLDRPLAFTSLLRLLRVEHAVHLENEKDVERASGEFFLLLYRDQEHAVRVIELGKLAFAALTRMMSATAVFDFASERLDHAPLPLGEALRAGSEATGVTLTDEILLQMSALLADFGDRGILLGALA